MLLEKKNFLVNSDLLVTFHNAAIRSLIMFGSVCWGENITKFGRGRLERIVKKKKKSGSCCGKATEQFEDTLCKKTVQRN